MGSQPHHFLEMIRRWLAQVSSLIAYSIAFLLGVDCSLFSVESLDGELQQRDSDIVGDINKHTSGTEFYGTSSNFVLLNQLFSHARSQASSTNAGRIRGNGTLPLRNPDGISEDSRLRAHQVSSGERSSNTNVNSLSHLADSRLSIVNLLYNDEAMLPPSRPKSPLMSGEEAQVLPISNTDAVQEPLNRNVTARQEALPFNITQSSQSIQSNLRSSRPKSPSGRPRQLKHSTQTADHVRKIYQPVSTRLEKEYIKIFFNNLHHLHPMLLVDEFILRCQTEVWGRSTADELRRDRMHFLALYNIVVAVGALIAGPDSLQGFENELGVRNGPADVNHSMLSKSSLNLSKTYFQKARSLLGDIFEVCSLESAQTLFYIVSHGRLYSHLH